MRRERVILSNPGSTDPGIRAFQIWRKRQLERPFAGILGVSLGLFLSFGASLASADGAKSPKPPVSEAKRPRYELYTVSANDTLMGIAFKLYGDMQRWQEIWSLNQSVLSAEPRPKPGLKLRVAQPGSSLIHDPECSYVNAEGENAHPISGLLTMKEPGVAEYAKLYSEQGCGSINRSIVQDRAELRLCYGYIQCRGDPKFEAYACEASSSELNDRGEPFCPPPDACLERYRAKQRESAANWGWDSAVGNPEDARLEASLKGKRLTSTSAPVRISVSGWAYCFYGDLHDASGPGQPAICVSKGPHCLSPSACAMQACLQTSTVDTRWVDYPASRP